MNTLRANTTSALSALCWSLHDCCNRLTEKRSWSGNRPALRPAYGRDLAAPDTGLMLKLLLHWMISFKIWPRYFRLKLVSPEHQLKFTTDSKTHKWANHFSGQLLGLCFQTLTQCFHYAPLYQFLSCPLITSPFKCIIFSDIVCRLLSEWLVTTSFYQRLQAMSFFTQLIVPYLRGRRVKICRNSGQTVSQWCNESNRQNRLPRIKRD